MAKKKSGDGDKSKKKKADGRGKSSRSKSGASSVDALIKLAEHPIVADLIAVGATAAVAAIATGRADKAGGRSSSAVKAAGKAAAAAIGARLMDEFKAVKQSAKEAGKKRDQA